MWEHRVFVTIRESKHEWGVHSAHHLHTQMTYFSMHTMRFCQKQHSLCTKSAIPCRSLYYLFLCVREARGGVIDRVWNYLKKRPPTKYNWIKFILVTTRGMESEYSIRIFNFEVTLIVCHIVAMPQLDTDSGSYVNYLFWF